MLQIKKTFKNYSYLFRFILSAFCILFIPAIILAFSVITNSYDEMVKKNNEYYEEITSSFMLYFKGQIEDLKTQANAIALEDRYPDFKISSDTIDSNEYYSLQAVNLLKKYKIGFPCVTDIGLHFNETDYIITSSNKYSINNFEASYLGSSPVDSRQLRAFLESSDSPDMRMFSTFDTLPYKKAKLLIGVPTALYGSEGATIFFCLTGDSINTSFFIAQGSDQFGFYIYSESGELMYTNLSAENKIMQKKEFNAFLKDDGAKMLKDKDSKFTAFKTNYPPLKMTFLSVIPENRVEKSYRSFYNITLVGVLIITMVFLMLICLTAYINYRPIQYLLKNITERGSRVGSNEIDTITDAFDEIEGIVSEQYLMLLDYILSNLLYGIPIQEHHRNRLDSVFTDGTYCVITISGAKLSTALREQITSTIKNECGLQIYIADILEKNHIALICVLDDTKTDALTKTIAKFLDAKLDTKTKIGVGNVVKNLDNIRESYLSSVSSLFTNNMPTENFQTNMSIAEYYPLEKITLFLQHVQDGNKEGATKSLEEIVAFVESNVKSFMLKKYVCYDILTAYIRCAQSVGYSLTKRETEELIAQHDIAELYITLTKSIGNLCDFIRQSRDETNKTLQKKIMEFINSNFMNAEFCRTQVADHFGISVYTLSRLVKDNVGIGFKEYISAKRIDLARELLIITDKSIVQISAEVGFANADYFSKVFKANCDVTPSDFRRKV